jgi:hypothetical protein
MSNPQAPGWREDFVRSQPILGDFRAVREGHFQAALAELSRLSAALAEKEEGRDALRFRYLIEHCSYHYGMSMAEPSPAEWGIAWSYQQISPGEQFETIESLIDAEMAFREREQR